MKSPLSALRLDQHEIASLNAQLQLRVRSQEFLRAINQTDEIERADRLVSHAEATGTPWRDLLPDRVAGKAAVSRATTPATPPRPTASIATPPPASTAPGESSSGKQGVLELSDDEIRATDDPRGAFLAREMARGARATGNAVRRLGRAVITSSPCGSDVKSAYPRGTETETAPTGILAEYAQTAADPTARARFIAAHEKELRALVA